MSSYAIIELEHSGSIDQPPLDLDPLQQYVYGQSFHHTWSVLDQIAAANGWEPLSSFIFSEEHQGDLNEQWFDAQIGLQTISGLLNLFFRLIGMGVAALENNSTTHSDLEINDLDLKPHEILLSNAINEDRLFSYALWDLRAYELILKNASNTRERFHIYVG